MVYSLLPLTEEGLLPAGTDVDRIVDRGDERELNALLASYFRRRGDLRRLAEGVLSEPQFVHDELDRIAPVSAMQALRANQRLAEIALTSRWIFIRDAREEGASWSAVGAALGMTKQAAWSWYREQIERQENLPPEFHPEADRARRVLVDEDPA